MTVMDHADDSSLCDAARGVRDELAAQDRRWRAGSTRRTFLKGVGMAGVAALGSQLVTTRAAYATTNQTSVNTLITIVLRGGVDGLRLLIPASSALGLDDLVHARPDLVPGEANRLALRGGNGWAMNGKLSPLSAMWDSGELAFIPAVMSPGATRSHFESQRNLSAGATKAMSTGWLDRLLAGIGPGTTFRAMGMGQAVAPAAYLGSEPDLVLQTLARFKAPSAAGRETQTLAAIEALYRGVDPESTERVAEIAAALRSATDLTGTNRPANGTKYPAGAFGQALADVATVLRAELGMQVCTLDVGGWDTHSAETTNLDSALGSLATALAAFFQDLGPVRRSRVTVMIQTEFGRRVSQNGSGGTDHGLGSVIMLAGGGLKASGVYGTWNGLKADTLDHGDVPGLNHPFDVMAELAQKRLGCGDLTSLFPDHQYAPIGLARI